ncbi:MAG: copper amine oxidase N-terminal domain-containing protein [Clostridiales bacterium]|nr:MAG: copper amine oxidase N-terminal domain-containing protein [Clostridiales bacterium]
MALKCANEFDKTFEETVRITVNGKELKPDKPAYVADGCTMIPMRCIFEALGASVEWNDETQTATADGIECSFAIGGDVSLQKRQRNPAFGTCGSVGRKNSCPRKSHSRGVRRKDGGLGRRKRTCNRYGKLKIPLLKRLE